MAVTYYALLTNVGAAKLANAAALGTTLQITQMAVGDGAGNVPVPDATRTALVNEVRRAPLNQLKIDPSNTSQVIAEQVIPETVGGWWIREIGLLDNTGALIAIANCAPSYKPQLAEGSGRTQTVRMVLIVNNTGAVELKIDPSVVLATREYVDTAIVTAINRQDAKASVRAATTASIALNGLPTVDGVVLVAGDRVLVKNQATGSQNGIYVAAAGAWARSADADENAEVTPSLTVSVESGTTLADTVWQLITDAPIVVGTTALVFQDITNGLARLASPAFTGTPTAPTAAPGTNTQQLATAAFVAAAIAPLAPAASPLFTGDPRAPTPSQFDNDTSLATTAFVQRALGSFAGYGSVVASRNMVLDDIGKALFVAAGSFNYTMPTPASLGLIAGAAVTIFTTLSTLTILPGAGAQLNHISTGGVASIAVLAGQSITMVAVTDTTWQSVQSTCGLGKNADFGASLAANGYQKLPGGLIMQWGMVPCPANYTAGAAVAFTLPIAFPNQVLWVTASNTGTNLFTTPTQVAAGLTTGQIVWGTSMATAASLQASYIAFGR